MNLFGGKFCWKEDGTDCTCQESMDPSMCECDRANFNSLLWALVTVFQVILLSTSYVLFFFFLHIFYVYWATGYYASWARKIKEACILRPP